MASNKWGVLLAACLVAACSGESGNGGEGAGGNVPCADTDADGVCDAADRCAGDDAADADGDTVPDGCDLCPGDDLADADHDEIPDACDICAAGDDDLDTDEDGVPNACDVCTGDDETDEDADGVPDACDVCAGGDDAADGDGDSIPDHCDVCAAGDDHSDIDDDGLADACDNCAAVSNADQTDSDGIAAVAIPYDPEESPSETIEILDNNTDDGTSALLDIGFEFQLFGETYTQLAVTTNGLITLGETGHQNEYWAQAIPAPGNWNGQGQVNALIAAVWTDLDFYATGTLAYELRGEAPNRRLVIEWKDVAYHEGDSDLPQVSAQVVLFEGSNAIEVHTDQQAWHPDDDSEWAVTRGVESADGAIAVYLPGEAYSYAPLGRTSVRFTTGATADGVGDACAARCSGDEDEDGVCDVYDICDGGWDQWDRDADGTPDDCDLCPDSPTGDTDGDGRCDDEDLCPAGDDSIDADEDGVADACDRCDGAPDEWDEDEDGVPDGCDICWGDDATGDDDADAVCGDEDRCAIGDDAADIDEDGTPDACDLCADAADYEDVDNDGVPNGCDACIGDNATGDTDADGTCDSQDVCAGDDNDADCPELPVRGVGATMEFSCANGDHMVGVQSRLNAGGEPQGAYVICRGLGGNTYAHGEIRGTAGEEVAAARCDLDNPYAYVIGQQVLVTGDRISGLGVICFNPWSGATWPKHISNTGAAPVDVCDREGEYGAGAWVELDGNRTVGYSLICAY